MNHQKVYESIIRKAKSENRKKLRKTSSDWAYYEEHHIIPKCINENNDKSNKVLLTAKEHFVCHKLLVYIYPQNKSIYNAFYLMCSAGKNKYNVSSRDYAYARELFVSIPISDKTKKLIKTNHIDITGEKNPMFGKHHTLEAKIIQGKSMKGKIPANKGLTGLYYHTEKELEKMRGPRNSFTEIHKQNISKSLTGNKYKKRTCPHCNKEIAKNNFNKWHGEKCKQNCYAN